MKTKAIYSTDSYQKEWESNVLISDDNGVVLDETIFYPMGGGQPTDKGVLIAEEGEFEITGISRRDGKLYHNINGTIKTHQKVKVVIDWDFRYKLMKHHTALHALSAVVYRKYEAKVTGGTIYENKARLDFDLQEFNKEIALQVVEELNEELKKDHQVEIDFLPREEADKNPELIRTKVNLLPKSITEIRTVKIGDIDLQADGGLHVHSTSEIGEVELLKIENKGKGRKRISIAIKDLLL